MSWVVRKEKETEETVEEIGCAMSMILKEISAGGKLHSWCCDLFCYSTAVHHHLRASVSNQRYTVKCPFSTSVK